MTPSALSHIKVLDLSRVLAGPWCAQILGDLGADVIKVENPDGGDDTRGWGPPFVTDSEGEQGDAAYYLCANRNKRSIAVDISRSEGQAIIRDLAARSDVVIENFKAGGLKKYGLDYDSLKAVKPDLIYCSVTGFGQTGPRAAEPGYDFLIQAMGGLMSVTGDDQPMKVGVPIVDLFTGVYAAGAIMAALIARDRGLGGQHVDMALFDVQTAMLANQACNYLVGGRAPGRMGNRHPNIVPYQDFPTADGRIAVAVGTDRQFRRFAEVLGHPEWSQDPRFARNADRVANREILCALIEKRMTSRPTATWEAELADAGIPCGPIRDITGVFADPQAEARGMRSDMDRTDGSVAPLVASPMRLGSTPAGKRLPPPLLGEHTRVVLRQELGLRDDEIEALVSSHAVRAM
jgi:crotonobetainyl-CoA:carnitine CoA-transferase CaiB-like acyl-CoA transferase